MWREANLFGVYMSPLVVYMLAAGLIHAVLRFVAVRLGVIRWIGSPVLTEAGVFVCILGMLVIWL